MKSEKYHLEDQIIPYLDLMTALCLGILVSVCEHCCPHKVPSSANTHSAEECLTINLIGCLVCFVWGASEEGLALRQIGFLEYTHTRTHNLSCIILLIPHSSSLLCSLAAHNITCSAYYINVFHISRFGDISTNRLFPFKLKLRIHLEIQIQYIYKYKYKYFNMSVKVQ